MAELGFGRRGRCGRSPLTLSQCDLYDRDRGKGVRARDRAQAEGRTTGFDGVYRNGYRESVAQLGESKGSETSVSRAELQETSRLLVGSSSESGVFDPSAAIWAHRLLE